MLRPDIDILWKNINALQIKYLIAEIKFSTTKIKQK